MGMMYAKSGSNLAQISNQMACSWAILPPELPQHHAIILIWVWNEPNKTLLAMVGSDCIMAAEFGWYDGGNDVSKIWLLSLGGDGGNDVRKIWLKSDGSNRQPNGLLMGHIATRTASTSCNHIDMGME